MKERTLVLGTAVALLLLLLTAPRPATALADLRTAGTATDPQGPLLAAVALLAWALAGWLLLVLALTLLGRLPGAAGRAGRGLVRRVAPGALRRTVEVALGLAVTATAVGASPALAAGADGQPDRPATAVSLDWHGAAGPDLDWPTAPAEPAAPPAAEVRGAPVPAAGADEVVVQPGDSLWRLAERDLAERTGAPPSDARTAAAWPAWWAANRDVVGDDPDLVHPGTVLQPPAGDPDEPDSTPG